MFGTRSFSNLLGAVALASCPLLATASAAADFPAGVYTTKGAPETITFGDNGRVSVNKDGVLEVEGAYSVNGDQIQLTDERGPWACTKPGEQTGAYRWKSDHGQLSFTKVADACTDRANSILKHTWKKQ
ncbi:MAG: hypothetical protein ACREEB_19060 [Caulobacteraceae bacterium]